MIRLLVLVLLCMGCTTVNVVGTKNHVEVDKEFGNVKTKKKAPQSRAEEK